MTVQALYTAATGMEALETKLDVIANNLANVNTTGFKKDRANFEDLLYRNPVLPGATANGGGVTANGVHVGLGTRVSSVQTDFGVGAIKKSSSKLHVAIEGRGFLQVTDPNGDVLYTRAGNLTMDATGQLMVGSAYTGRPLQPAIQIPTDATDVQINADGAVQYRSPGSTTFQTAGNILLANFINPEGLLKVGENLYAETDASSSPTPGTPGQNGLGKLLGGMLETSNVEPVQELVDLITTQRSFELNSQAVQAGDQVLQLVANLRRF